jgi:hypothetical protein
LEGKIGLRAVSGMVESEEIKGTYDSDFIALKSLPSSSGGGGGGGGCFIATAAYGSYFEPSVEILKKFRDRFLIPTPHGLALVQFYYRHSPSIAHFIAKINILRVIVRIGLIPIVGMSYIAINTNSTEKIFLTFLFLIFLITGIWHNRRHTPKALISILLI